MTFLEKVHKLKQAFDTGEIPRLLVHEVYPKFKKDSRESYLYFTLPPCINFQRSSPLMWQSALNTFEDPTTNYVFFPEQVAISNYEKFKVDMAKHNLALLRNKHCEIWAKISKTLYDVYDCNPKNILKEGAFDVVKIKKLIQREKKELFPHLRGEKLCNYWLMLVSYLTEATLANLQEISIIPDTHIIQSTVRLGLLNEKDATQEKVSEVWKELLSRSNITPVEMHPVLWNWSRNNFMPEF